MRRSLVAPHLQPPAPPRRTSCGRCGDSFTGTAGDGRAWLAAHTVEAHTASAGGATVMPLLRPAPLEAPSLRRSAV